MYSSMSGIKKHWPALALALLMGAMVVAPYAYFTREPSYAGVALWGEASEEYYVARVEEVYNGYPLLRNVYLPYKDVPYIVPALGEDLVAYSGEALRVSAAAINIVWKFFSPLLAFLLIYALAFSVSRSRGTGLLAGAAAMLGLDLLSYPAHLLPLLRGVGVGDGLFWARPVNPEISGTLLFGALLVLYQGYYRGDKPRWWHTLLLGLLIGAALYISVFIWVFLGALLTILFLVELWRRHRPEALGMLGAGLLALASAIPFISNYLHARAYPTYANVAMQQGIAPLHTPEVGVWIFVLLLLPLVWWPKSYARARTLFIAAAAALFIVLNQQVITGVYLQPAHFHSYITKPLVLVLLSLYVGYFCTRIPSRLLRIEVFAVPVIVLLLFGIMSQVHFYELHAPDSRAAQAYAPLLAYLDARPEETVFNNCESAYPCLLSEYISMYTADNAPGSKYAALSLARPGYFQELLFLHYRLMGVTAEEALPAMERDQADILMRLYGEYWQLHDGTPSAVPKDEIAQLARAYASYASHPIPSMMRDLGITTLVQDEQGPAWTADLSTFAHERIANRFDVYVFR